jgi:hypothetical protein
VTENKPFPDVSTIYWELDLLFKETYEGEFTEGDVAAPEEEAQQPEQEHPERPKKKQKQKADPKAKGSE